MSVYLICLSPPMFMLFIIFICAFIGNLLNPGLFGMLSPPSLNHVKGLSMLKSLDDPPPEGITLPD